MCVAWWEMNAGNFVLACPRSSPFDVLGAIVKGRLQTPLSVPYFNNECEGGGSIVPTEPPTSREALRLLVPKFPRRDGEGDRRGTGGTWGKRRSLMRCCFLSVRGGWVVMETFFKPIFVHRSNICCPRD